MKVVLPAPFGPIRPRISPRSTGKGTPPIACSPSNVTPISWPSRISSRPDETAAAAASVSRWRRNATRGYPHSPYDGGSANARLLAVIQVITMPFNQLDEDGERALTFPPVPQGAHARHP